MLAPWKRGGRSALMSVPTAAAVFAVVGAAQVGCESPMGKADKQVQANVDKAARRPGTSAKDPAVAAAVDKALGGTAPPAVADALAALGAYDAAQPDTAGEWRQKSRALTLAQKDAIASAIRAAGVKDREAVIADLEAAAKVDGASPEAKVDALLRLATARAAVADASARDAAAREVVSAQRVDAALRLLAQVRLNTVRADYLKKLDPKATTDAVAALKAKAAGSGADSVWAGEGESALPAGTAIDAAASKAQADLDALAAKRKEATDKAAKLREEVARLTGESKKQTGELAYASAVEASKQNQQATELDIETQGLDRQILDAQGRLAIAQARKPVVEDALKSFDLRTQQAQDRWKTIQDLAAQTTDLSRKIVIGDGTAAAKIPTEDPALTGGGAASRPASAKLSDDDLKKLNANNFVAARVAQATAAANEAEELRKQAADLYQAALDDLGKAKDTAGAATKALQDRKAAIAPTSTAEVAGVTGRIDLLDASQFAYAEAEVRQRLARLQADKAIGTAVRADLRAEATKALQAAGIEPVPEAVAALPQAKDKDAEVRKADDLFAAAEASLEPFFGTEGPDAAGPLFADNLKTTRGQYSQAAGGLLINGRYARGRVLALGGADKAAIDKQQAAAVAAATAYKSRYENALPAAVPGEMLATFGVKEATVPSASSRPASAPAAAPAPAPEAAPAPAPAPAVAPAPAPAPVPESTPPAGTTPPASAPATPPL